MLKLLFNMCNVIRTILQGRISAYILILWHFLKVFFSPIFFHRYMKQLTIMNWLFKKNVLLSLLKNQRYKIMSSFHFLQTKDITGWTRARFTTSQFKGWGKKLLLFHNNEAFSAHMHWPVNEWFSCANNIGHNVSFLEKKNEYIFVNNFNSYF